MKVDNVGCLPGYGTWSESCAQGSERQNAESAFPSFDMKINNPALTGQVLVCVGRASMRLKPGCYTMIEIPVVDLPAGRSR